MGSYKREVSSTTGASFVYEEQQQLKYELQVIGKKNISSLEERKKKYKIDCIQEK